MKRLRIVGVVLLLALIVAGCSFLSGVSKTVSTLHHDGYQDPGVNIQTGTGLPHDGLVVVSYQSGPTGNSSQDAYNAARIVWSTLRYRFGALVIEKTSGGCAGNFCVGSNNELGGETYAQMQTQFGARPPGLDATSASSAVSFPVWIPAVVGVLIVVGAIVAVAAIVRKRRRPRYQPPWLGNPAQPWPPPPGAWPPR